MPRDEAIVKFREYTHCNYLGGLKENKPQSSNKRYPFLGYRKFDEVLLPIIKVFSPEEFGFTSELPPFQKKLIEYSYKKKDGKYILKEKKDLTNLSKTEYEENTKKIWKVFQSTTYFSLYYRCLPYLLPDYESSIPIEDKYIYVFRQIKSSGFPTIYREYYVQSNKYYQVEIKAGNNEDGSSFYYLEENRQKCNTGLNSISLPFKQNGVEYEYIFVLSLIKLSVKRVNTLLNELRNNRCKRGKKKTLYKNTNIYNKSRNSAMKIVNAEIAAIKNSYSSNFMKLLKTYSKSKIGKHLVSLIPKVSHLPYFEYEDILYTPSEGHQTIFLIDYLAHTKKLKNNFKKQIDKYNCFLEEKDENTGFLKTEMKSLNDFISSQVKKNSEDTDEVENFKEKLKDKLRKNKQKKYLHEIWRDEYNKSHSSVRKALEISGLLLTAAVDSEEFTSLQYDYHFLVAKISKTDDDKKKYKAFIEDSSEIISCLGRVTTGKLFLYRMIQRVNKNIKYKSSNSTEDNVDNLIKNNIKKYTKFENFYDKCGKTGDWFTPIFTNIGTPVSKGICEAFKTYLEHVPLKDNHIVKLVAIQKITLKKTTRLKSYVKKSKAIKSNNEKIKSIANFGSNILERKNTFKLINGNSKGEITAEVYEVGKMNVPIVMYALDTFCLGMDIWNLRILISEYRNNENSSLYSVEALNITWSITQLVIPIIGLKKVLTKTALRAATFDAVGFCIDFIGNSKKLMNNLANKDYDAAIYNSLSITTSLSMFAYMSASSISGAKLGGGGGLGGIIIGVFLGALCGVFSYLADKAVDTDYEIWFNYSIWGNRYGEYRRPTSFSNVDLKKWSLKGVGIRYQFEALNYLLYAPKLVPFVKQTSKKIKIGVDILPNMFSNESTFKISAKIKSKNDTEEGVALCHPSSLPLIYRPNLVGKFIPLGTNCDIKMDKKKNKPQSIIVRWEDASLMRSRSIYFKNLTKTIEGMPINLAESTAYFEVKLEIDINGDGKQVITTEACWEMTRINSYSIKFEKVPFYRKPAIRGDGRPEYARKP